jgi:HD-like signal output (HDOD) protein
MAVDAREFLSQLESDFTAKSISIAGFPEVCVRLLRELRDPYASNTVISALVSQDAKLSRRVILMANSAAYRSATGPAVQVRAAVARIGLSALRTVVIAYAFAEIKEQEIYRHVSARIGVILARGMIIASVSRVLLGMTVGRRADRDAVSLSGLLSGVGKVYILTEASHHPEVLFDFAAVQHLLSTWGSRFTRKLLTDWNFSEEIVKAASGMDHQPGLDSDDPVSDILYVSSMFADMKDEPEDLARRLQVSAPAMRLGFQALDPVAVFKAAEEEATAMNGTPG